MSLWGMFLIQTTTAAYGGAAQARGSRWTWWAEAQYGLQSEHGEQRPAPHCVSALTHGTPHAPHIT